MNTPQDLKDLRAEKSFFIGIDSDGCVFDSMEPKHKECFCPAFINNFNLQSVSKYAREAWDFVNLYSQDRGCNRFHAVMKALDLLRGRSEVKKRGAKIMELPVLKAWTQRESKLGNPTLKAELEKTGDPELKTVYQWSLDVNEAVAKIVRGVPPFPLFRESLDRMRERADVIVVSQTPTEALVREWAELGIDKLVRFIAGQEIGTKSEHLAYAAAGKYPPNRILMIGDAPGDLKAAKSVDALFYPVIPGAEDESWRRFREEALDKFFGMGYEGAYQEGLLAEFKKSLPEKAPWQN
ncbi:MAG: HAD family hydrolase [Spirochaetia bacterium]|jgi:phosphoglycolate phosphatase-like HAD superfamily hydrolase|nr:HAD family hydrolase [Spirochaetia bacterium]